MRAPDANALAPVLWLLLALFVARVLGQVLVELLHVTFLPPSEYWQSGLLPYPVLLTLQIVIIAAMAFIAVGFSTQRRAVVAPHPSLGKKLFIFGEAYASIMAARAVACAVYQMQGRPFLGGWIPIVFHFVLAAFVLLLGWYHRFAEGSPARSPRKPGDAIN